MGELKQLLESIGYTGVKTLLASGNVLFTAPKASAVPIQTRLEKELAKKFGFAIPVILRAKTDLEKLAARKPFDGIEVTPETRLYVTFLTQKPSIEFTAPYSSGTGHFSILQVTDTEVCSVLTLSADEGTVDAMAILEKRFGKNVTTRNWNTVEKLLALGSG